VTSLLRTPHERLLPAWLGVSLVVHAVVLTGGSALVNTGSTPAATPQVTRVLLSGRIMQPVATLPKAPAPTETTETVPPTPQTTSPARRAHSIRPSRPAQRAARDTRSSASGATPSSAQPPRRSRTGGDALGLRARDGQTRGGMGGPAGRRWCTSTDDRGRRTSEFPGGECTRRRGRGARHRGLRVRSGRRRIERWSWGRRHSWRDGTVLRRSRRRHVRAYRPTGHRRRRRASGLDLGSTHATSGDCHWSQARTIASGARDARESACTRSRASRGAQARTSSHACAEARPGPIAGRPVALPFDGAKPNQRGEALPVIGTRGRSARHSAGELPRLVWRPTLRDQRLLIIRLPVAGRRCEARGLLGGAISAISEGHDQLDPGHSHGCIPPQLIVQHRPPAMIQQRARKGQGGSTQ